MADFLNDMFHHSTANLTGGEDFFAQDGSLLGHSSDNLMGGENFYDNQGNLVGHSSENLLGGEDYFDAQGNRVGFSAAGLHGSDAVHGATGEHLGSFEHSVSGTQFHGVGGDITTFRQNLMGGFTVDPLQNMNSVAFPPMF